MNKTAWKAFLDEIEKIGAQRKKKRTLESLVHHPLAQAAGYGALAGEGAHALMEHSKHPRLKAFAASKPGKAFGKASLIGSTVFLGAEGLAALKSWLSKRTRKK